MPRTRQELERLERRTLAPYAQFSADSRGRKYIEAPPEWRTEYQRDRDRVIHSRAFRRLEYKTQVFLNGTGDHLRTRLTHTMEVAAIARNIARALRLNEDLAETIALAHDLGHPPFGHKGEEVLNQLMARHGGFEHNQQSVRTVEELEQKYPAFPGLNLTWESREGLVKHFTAHDHPSRRPGFDAKSSSLEAQVANVADEIAYYSHDLDDGLEAGLLSGTLADECRRYFIIRCLIDDQVRDVVVTTEQRLADAGVRSADAVRLQSRSLAGYSSGRRRLNLELREYLYRNLYYNPKVHRPHLRAARILRGLFRHYRGHPETMGGLTRKRIRQAGLERAVCDYLAGMTDRYVQAAYDRLVGATRRR
jgi:dGTPase